MKSHHHSDSPSSDHHHPDHQDHHHQPRASGRVRLLLGLILLPLLLATGVATNLLWPSHIHHASPQVLGPPDKLVNATVKAVRAVQCAQEEGQISGCVDVTLALTGGPSRGQIETLHWAEGPGNPTIHYNDRVILGQSSDPRGQGPSYYFVDFQRKQGLAILAGAFALLVVLVGRWRGLGALAGLVVTWLVVTTFILPALLDGRSPLAVALTGSAAIVLVVLYVAHGVNARTTTALIGTLISLALVGGLAAFAVTLTHLTGIGSDEATYVQNFAGQINLHGLLLGGMVIGSLGVLNDMTVTQASAVWEIHRAQPGLRWLSLYRSGMRVGRDHIASTVYTLVLAYTGAALPLLVLFTLANRRPLDVVSGEMVAEEVVRTLVGGIGILASVPITTALAALVATAQPAAASASVAEPETAAAPTETGVLAPEPESAPRQEPESQPVPAPRQESEAESVLALTLAPEPVSGSELTPIQEGIWPMAPDPAIFTAEGRSQPEPPRSRWGRRLPSSSTPVLEDKRKLSRRERKFWNEG